jgi:hypothetical protein
MATLKALLKAIWYAGYAGMSPDAFIFIAHLLPGPDKAGVLRKRQHWRGLQPVLPWKAAPNGDFSHRKLLLAPVRGEPVEPH